MARPRKIEQWLVHRIADFFRYADQLSDLGEPLPDGLLVWLASSDSLDYKPLPIKSARTIPNFIGYVLCELHPKMRPYVLRRIADALEEKLPDNIAKTRQAYHAAQAAYLPSKIKPTFKEVLDKSKRRLDRRTLKEASCPVRPERRTKRLPRRK